MPIITLTTDLGLKDHYVASLKGAIYSECPDVRIVDISHNVNKFDIVQAAFLVKNVYPDFPQGTIHVIGVIPESQPDVLPLCVLCDSHYFISADNGIFSLLFDRKPDKITELVLVNKKDCFTFPLRDILIKAACHIARGGKPEMIGKLKNGFREKNVLQPTLQRNTIRGTVIYVDDYGNAITNISSSLFMETAKGRRFTIAFRTSGYDITRLSRNYTDVDVSERLALFGSTGLLEIAIHLGNASQLLGLKLNDTVSVDFYDE